MKITTSTVSFEPGPFKPLPIVRMVFRQEPSASTPTCSCPDGLAATYCVYTTDFPDGIALCLSGDCYWCGLDPDAGHPIELFIDPSAIGAAGRCLWKLGFNSQTVVLYKEWADGDPEGEYGLIDNSGEPIEAPDFTAIIGACALECSPC